MDNPTANASNPQNKYTYKGRTFDTEKEIEDFKREEMEREKEADPAANQYSYSSSNSQPAGKEKVNPDDLLCIPENGVKLTPPCDIPAGPKDAGVLFADGKAIAIIDPETGKFFLTADADPKEAGKIIQNFTVNGQKMECLGVANDFRSDEIKTMTKKQVRMRNRQLFGKEQLKEDMEPQVFNQSMADRVRQSKHSPRGQHTI